MAKKKSNKQALRRMNIQLYCATTLVLAGIVLLFLGFWVAPTGQIHDSVLIGFGEVMTFAGALFGIDYTYRFKKFKNLD